MKRFWHDENRICNCVYFFEKVVWCSDGAVDSIEASSIKVWIQLDKMFLTLFLLPSWMRCKLYGRKCVLMYFLFIWWLLLGWFFIMNNYIIDIKEDVWWCVVVQVLTKYPVDGVDGRLKTLRSTGNHCVGCHCFVNHSVITYGCVTHSSVFHINWDSHYGLRKGKKRKPKEGRTANEDEGVLDDRGHQDDKM